MRMLPFRHHNNCPRCPAIGAEGIPGDEFYEILAIEKIGHCWCDAGDIEYFPAANRNDARSRAVFRLTPHAANEQGTVEIVRQIAGI